jgi:hypothetical protein
LFKEKSRQLDEQALIETKRHRSIQDSHKLYKRLHDVKRIQEAQVVEIDLPRREEIESVLKYPKNNKATGADSSRATEKRWPPVGG